MSEKAKNVTVGSMVDELADKYFAAGLDAYHANVRACLDVAEMHIACFNLFKRFLASLSKSAASSEEVPK